MSTCKKNGPAILVCSILIVGFFELVLPGPMGQVRADGPVRFTEVVLDADGPRGDQFFGMHTKAVGDLDGDGYPDAIVAGATLGEPLLWYKMPAGNRQVISDLGGWSTDAAVGDIDNDGDADILISSWYRDEQGLEWFENLGGAQDWARHAIGAPHAHDLELVDLDLDGDLDIVTRLQEDQGNAVQVWRQDNPSSWTRATITQGVSTGEGLAVGDIDGDGDPDIVLNNTWLANPRDIIGGEWVAHTYSTSWTEPDTIVALGDINRDGRLDIVLTPSEAAGETYRISWFQNPADPLGGAEWVENVIDSEVETVLHSLQLADVDKDGDLDVITAAMHQGQSPVVAVYLNMGTGGTGTDWARHVISNTGTHSLRIADFDLDGDVDLFGAHWSDSSNVYMWRNDLNERLPLDKWARHVLDESRPWNAVFIEGGDIDGDGLPDVITGGWWYRNPGDPAGAWARNTIGPPLHNMAAVYDFDQDGDLDVLGTPWQGSGESPALFWAENDGAGNFEIRPNVPAAQGDFLQGVAVDRFAAGWPIEVALSWHAGTGNGVQMLSVPPDPANQDWTWDRISETDQQEQLSSGDIDRDGDVDLLLGTQWLRNDGGGFSLHVISSTSEAPDRNKLGDMNKDGRLDAIVGFVGISEPARVVWYEQGQDPTQPWTEHEIDTVIGPMSLDVADIDLDGDLDVVVGEHNLEDPASARVIIFENADGLGTTWAARLVHTGDEHHDGTQLVDIDLDGDLDIVSIGWGHSQVLLYQNMAMESGERITGQVPPDIPPPPDPTPGPADPDQPEPPVPPTPDPQVPDEDVAGDQPLPPCGACGQGGAAAATVGLLLMGTLRVVRARMRHRRGR